MLAPHPRRPLSRSSVATAISSTVVETSPPSSWSDRMHPSQGSSRTSTVGSGWSDDGTQIPLHEEEAPLIDFGDDNTKGFKSTINQTPGDKLRMLLKQMEAEVRDAAPIEALPPNARAQTPRSKWRQERVEHKVPDAGSAEEEDSPPTPPMRITNPYLARKKQASLSPQQAPRLPSRAAVLRNSITREVEPEAGPSRKTPLETFIASQSVRPTPVNSPPRQSRTYSPPTKKGKERASFSTDEETSSRRRHAPRKWSVELAPRNMEDFALDAENLEVRGEVELDIEDLSGEPPWDEAEHSQLEAEPPEPTIRNSSYTSRYASADTSLPALPEPDEEATSEEEDRRTLSSRQTTMFRSPVKRSPRKGAPEPSLRDVEPKQSPSTNRSRIVVDTPRKGISNTGNITYSATPHPPGRWAATPRVRIESPKQSPASSAVGIHRLKLSPRKPARAEQKDGEGDEGNSSFLGRVPGLSRLVAKPISIPPKSTTVHEAKAALLNAAKNTSTARAQTERVQQQWLDTLLALQHAGGSAAQVVRSGWTWSTWTWWLGVEILLVWGVFRVTLDYATSARWLSAMDPLSIPRSGSGYSLSVPLPSAVSSFVVPHRGSANFFDLLERAEIWRVLDQLGLLGDLGAGVVGEGVRMLGGVPTVQRLLIEAEFIRLTATANRFIDHRVSTFQCPEKGRMSDVKWAADERRLQSAYDDMSAGRLKAAQAAVDKALKKSPKSQPALILRMAILEKAGGSEADVLKAYKAAKALGEPSARGVWWISVVFRNMQRQDLTLQMYTELWSTRPQNPELGEQVFLHAVAAWDKETMCSSSRKMFNMLKSQAWARVAAWAEFISKAPEPPADQSFGEPAPANALRIATTLLSTTVSTNPSAEILWLRLQIQVSAGNLKEALEMAQSDGADGSLSRTYYRIQAVQTILSRLSDKGEEEEVEGGWRKEFDWVHLKIQLDNESQRNYLFYQHLLRCLEKLKWKKEDVSGVQSSLKALHEQIGSRERSPLLLTLELDDSLIKAGLEGMEESRWKKLVEEYWVSWGSRGSIVSELEGIVRGDHKRRETILSMAKEKAANPHTDLQAYKEVVHAELYLLRSHPVDWQPSRQDISRVWELYIAGLAYGRNLPETDVQPVDDIGLAAVQLILIEWNESGEEAALLDAVCRLRYILSKSPSSAHAKVLLSRISRLTGSASTLTDEKLYLSPSEIQLDTLLHVSVERGAGEAYAKTLRPDWQAEVQKAARMYKRTASDFPEYVKQCSQYESYAQVSSLREMGRLQTTSLPAQITRVEQARFNLLSGSALTAEAVKLLRKGQENAEKDELVDNRDWLVFDIGGDRQPISELLSLGNVDNAWAKEWSQVLLAVSQYGSGYPGSFEAESKLSVPDRHYLNAVTAVLRYTLSSAEPSSIDAPMAKINELVEAAKNPQSSSRWHQLYPALLLVELSKTLEVIIKTVEEQGKPVAAGKSKSKADPKITAILANLRKLKEAVKSGMKEVGEVLERLTEVSPDSLDSLPQDQKDHNDTIIKQVMSARTEGLRNVVSLLNGKKLP